MTAALVSACLICLAVLAPAASAQNLSEVLDDLSRDGVYVSPGRGDIDKDALLEVVEGYRFEGVRVVVVAPINPEPTAAAYARRVQEATLADIAIVLVKDGPIESYVIDDLQSELLRAAEAVRGVEDPAEAIVVLTDELLSDAQTKTPTAIIWTILVAVLLLAIVITIFVMEQRSRPVPDKVTV